MCRREHLLRSIDRFVELDGLRRELAPFYSEMGRPSIDPELMIRMLIVGYCFGIRSERRLCEEVHLNLAYRWFCRLGLDGAVPDHSTFSKNRHGRFRESDLLRRLFETRAAALHRRGAGRRRRLRRRRQPDPGRRQRPHRVPGCRRVCRRRRPAVPSRNISPSSTMPRSARRREVTPKFIAPADPATRWTAAHRGPAFFAYSDQLPDRYRQRDHRRCRSDDRDPSGRGDGGKAHDRALARSASISIPSG